MRHCIRRVSPRGAKRVSDKAPSHLHVTETRNVSFVSQKHLHVSCYDKLSLFIEGDRGAVEMSWVDVPGDKLFEPIVTIVSLCFVIIIKYSLSICLIIVMNIQSNLRMPATLDPRSSGRY